MHQPNLDHPTHDLTLVAAHAAGDLPEPDRIRTQALLESCRDCADLHRDLIDIASATHALPAPLARTRDFQLTSEHAQRLRRGSWLRAALRPFGATGSPLRPMAAAFTSLGIAGLVFAAALSGVAGGAAMSAPNADTTTGGAGQPGATAAPAFVAGQPAPQAGAPTTAPGAFEANGHTAPPQASDSAVKAGPAQSAAAPVAVDGTTSGTERGGSSGSLVVATSPPNPLVIGSLALLAVGLALFGLRFAGRRVR